MRRVRSRNNTTNTIRNSLRTNTLAAACATSRNLLLVVPGVCGVTKRFLPYMFRMSTHALTSRTLYVFNSRRSIVSTHRANFTVLTRNSMRRIVSLTNMTRLTAVGTHIPFVGFFSNFHASRRVRGVRVLRGRSLTPLISRRTLTRFHTHTLGPVAPITHNVTRGPSRFFRRHRSYGGCCRTIPTVMRRCVGRVSGVANHGCNLFSCCKTRSTRHMVVTVNSMARTTHRTVSCLMTGNRGMNVITIRLCHPFSTGRFLTTMPGATGSVTILSHAGRPNTGNRPLCLSMGSYFCKARGTPIVMNNHCNLNSGSAAPTRVVSMFRGLTVPVPGGRFAVNVMSSMAFASLPRGRRVTLNNRDVFRTGFCKLNTSNAMNTGGGSIGVVNSGASGRYRTCFSCSSGGSKNFAYSRLHFNSAPVHSACLMGAPGFITYRIRTCLRVCSIAHNLHGGNSFLLGAV